MLLIDREDLEARGIECQGVSEFVFLDKCFQKGRTFDNYQRETAIASCRQMLDAGLMSLIVNYKSHFTIWVETNIASEPQPGPAQAVDPQSNDPAEEKVTETDERHKSMVARLNKPVDMKAMMSKLNKPIHFKSLFSREQESQS